MALSKAIASTLLLIMVLLGNLTIIVKSYSVGLEGSEDIDINDVIDTLKKFYKDIVVVEAFKYRRLLPLFHERYPASGNPCDMYVEYDSRHRELYCWLEQIYIPATESVDLKNNSVATIPKGDSFLITLAPIHIVEALAGVDSINKLIEPRELYEYTQKEWGDYIPVREGEFLKYKPVKFIDRAPPDIIDAYYIYYYRKQLAEDKTDSPIKTLPMWSFLTNYYKLVHSIREFFAKYGYDITQYNYLVVEWIISDPSKALLYPVTMTSRLPPDIFDYRLGEKIVYAPTHDRFDYDTEFPIPLPLYSTPYYVSTIDVYNPIETLVENMVFIAPRPQTYSGSFDLIINVKTGDGRKIVTLKYRFNIGGEYWRFLETNQALLPPLPCASIRQQVLKEFGVSASEYCSVDDKLTVPYYIGSVKTLVYNFEILKGTYSRGVPLEFSTGPNSLYIELLYKGFTIESVRATVNAETRLVGYGSYGEAYVVMNYRYEYTYVNTIQRTGFEKFVPEEAITVEIVTRTFNGLFKAGGTLPFPSPVVLGYRVRDSSGESEYRRVTVKYHRGTGLVGYIEERINYLRRLSGRSTMITYKVVPFAKAQCSEFLWARCKGDCPKEPEDFTRIFLPFSPVTIYGIIAGSITVKAYSNFKGFGTLNINGYLLYLWPTSVVNDEPDYYPVRNYKGTGKPNYLAFTYAKTYPRSDDSLFNAYYQYTRYEPDKMYGYIHMADSVHYESRESGDEKSIFGVKCMHYAYVEHLIYKYKQIEYRGVEAYNRIIHLTIPNMSYVYSYANLLMPPTLVLMQSINPSLLVSGVTYMNVDPVIVTTVPEGRAEYVIDAKYKGRKLSGEKIVARLKYGDEIVSTTESVFDRNGFAKIVIRAPSIDELSKLVGEDMSVGYNVSERGEDRVPVISFDVEFIIPSKKMVSYATLEVKIVSGIVGKVVAIDFDVDYGTNTTLWLGTKVIQSHYMPRIQDPRIDRVPSQMILFVDNSIESISDNLFRELGLNASVDLIVISLENISERHRIHINSTSYAKPLKPGKYFVYLEINVTLWSGETLSFTTKEKIIEVSRKNVTKLDFYIPLTPVLRVLKILDDLSSWKILNVDLAYLVENFVHALPDDLVSAFGQLFVNTGMLLYSEADKYKAQYKEQFFADILFKDKPIDANYSFYNYVRDMLAKKIMELGYYLMNGGRDPSKIRELAIGIATVKAPLLITKRFRDDIYEFFIYKPLPEYKTGVFISNPRDPWNKLYRLMLVLAFVSNLRPHIIRQLRIGVKFIALLSSLQAKDYIIKNKMFPVGNGLSKLFNKIGDLLGGDKSIIVKTVGRVFPFVQRTLNALKIAAFTLTGMGLNIGLTNEEIKQWLMQKGYRGIDLGYAIAHFFKFYRFVLSIIVNAAETDTVFEIVFHSVTQFASWLFLTMVLMNTNYMLTPFYQQLLDGEATDSIYDAMFKAYVGDGAANGVFKIFEVIVSSMGLAVNFFRGFGGLMDYVSGLATIKAFKKLIGSTPDKDIFLHLLATKGVKDALDYVYGNNKLLGFMGKYGRGFVKIGERLIAATIALVFIDIIFTQLTIALTSYHVLKPSITSLKKFIYDYSMIRLLGKYGCYDDVNIDPMNRSTYTCSPNLINAIKGFFRIVFNTPTYQLGYGLETIYSRDKVSFRNYPIQQMTSIKSIDELEKEIIVVTNKLVENNYLDLDSFTQLVMYDENVRDQLYDYYVRILSKSANDYTLDDIYAINLINRYEILMNEFIEEVYAISIMPEEDFESLIDLGNITLETINEIKSFNWGPYTGVNAKVYRIEIEPMFKDDNHIVLKIKRYGSRVTGNLKLYIYSSGYTIEPVFTSIDLSSRETSIDITIKDKGFGSSVLTFSIVDEEKGNVIASTTVIAGSIDYFNTVSYRSSLGDILSIKQLNVVKDRDGLLEVRDIGNNIMIIESSKPVSLKTFDGIGLIRTIKVNEENYITIVRTINCSKAVFSLSNTIQVNTVTLKPGEGAPPIMNQVVIITVSAGAVSAITLFILKFLLKKI